MHHVWGICGKLGFKQRYVQEPLEKDDYFDFIRNSPYNDVFDFKGYRS